LDGGRAQIIKKLGAFARTQESVQRWRNTADLQSAIAARQLFYTKTPLSWASAKTLPRLVRHHPNQYYRKGLLAQNPPSLLRRLLGWSQGEFSVEQKIE
jgi:hypothetical protein